MIRVFSGGRYTLKAWEDLACVLREGLQSLCPNDCENCPYNFTCREVSQAITYCDVKANKLLADKNKSVVN